MNTYTAFDGNSLFCRGSLVEVVSKIKKRIGEAENSSILIFSDESGETLDFNFKGSERDVVNRLEIYVPKDSPVDKPGPGRPKLGVISREVSLLPRHWEWLAMQKGGASVTLRNLVEEAKKKASDKSDIKRAQERVYNFMSILAGDFTGYEEALRALYRKDEETFLEHTKSWPNDVKTHIIDIAKPVFQGTVDKL